MACDDIQGVVKQWLAFVLILLKLHGCGQGYFFIVHIIFAFSQERRWSIYDCCNSFHPQCHGFAIPSYYYVHNLSPFCFILFESSCYSSLHFQVELELFFFLSPERDKSTDTSSKIQCSRKLAAPPFFFFFFLSF